MYLDERVTGFYYSADMLAFLQPDVTFSMRGLEE